MSTLTEQPEKSQNASASAVRYAQPRVDVQERAGDFLIQADLPGVGKESVEVRFHDGELTIEGRRETARGPLNRPAVQYRRVFAVDPAIDAVKITASAENGVLSVTLPKAESAQPRQISVS